MIINRNEIEKYFSIRDIIISGGGRSSYEITDILDQLIRIKPTKGKTPSRLKYEKLSAVINYIELIDPKSIEISVGDVLEANNLKDTQNEVYLYGMAKEYLKRKNLPFTLLIQKEFEEAIENSKVLTSSKRKNRLKNAHRKPEQIFAIIKIFKRNPDVIVEVLERANGFCEHCNSKAPFQRLKDNTPYLEVHHKIQLSIGGEDTVVNAIALCPNCHREAHFGINASTIQ